MSYCKQEGKDTIIFLTEEDASGPSKAVFTEEEDEEPGLITDSGEINWNCPCLGGMATGPCGPEFRESFSCFHYSEAEPKGSDCYEQFKNMQECMANYPSLYDPGDKDDKEVEDLVNQSLDELDEELDSQSTQSTQYDTVPEKNESGSSGPTEESISRSGDQKSEGDAESKPDPVTDNKSADSSESSNGTSSDSKSNDSNKS